MVHDGPRFGAQGRGERALQDDAPGLQHHEVLVARPRRRAYLEPVQLVPFAGAEPQHLRVDVGQFLPQHGAGRAEQGVRLGGLRDSGPVPAEEVPLECGAGGARVPFEQFGGVSVPRREQRGRQPSDTSADDQHMCHCVPPSL